MGKQKFQVGDYTYTMEKFDPNDGALPSNDKIIGPPPDRAFVQTIANEGIWYPIIFTDCGGYLFLIDGGRRLKAARMLELEYIVAQVFEEVDPNDQKAISVILNDQRSRNIAIEYLHLASLRDEDYDAFLQRCQMDPARARKAMSLDKIREEYRYTWLDAHVDGKIGKGPLFDAAKLTPVRQDYLWGIFEKTGKFTGKDVSASREASNAAVLESASFLGEEVQIPEVIVSENLFAVLDPSEVAEEMPAIYIFNDWHKAFELAQETGYKMFRLVEV